MTDFLQLHSGLRTRGMEGAVAAAVGAGGGSTGLAGHILGSPDQMTQVWMARIPPDPEDVLF